MPVRELAPALLALGDLFTEASKAVYPDLPPVALNIKATEDGSFLVHLYLHADDAWEDFRDLFTSPGASALLSLKEYVVGGGVGLFWLYKKLHGRRIASEDNAPEPGHVRLTLDDGTTLDVPGVVVELHKRPTIRRRARDVVAPLEQDGIEVVEFKGGGMEDVVIEDDDLPSFDSNEEEGEVVTDQVIELWLEVVTAAFAEGNKWRFSDGQSRFNALIEDDQFMRRVNNHIEVFGKGDTLRCRMRIIQTQGPNGLHTERHIVRIFEHTSRPMQMGLLDEEA
jgi:hypothetical protein